MAKVFGWVFVVMALMGGCAVALEKAGAEDEAPSVQATAGSNGSQETTAGLEICLDLVASKPGDVAFIESHGWKIVCSESGDPELDASGDLETLGYTNFQKKTIFLDASLVDASVIVHEATHALDDIAFDILIREGGAMELGQTNWDTADSYWQTPAEVFAESRTGCLGYSVYEEFAVMSCSLIDEMIGKSEFASSINTQAVLAK